MTPHFLTAQYHASNLVKASGQCLGTSDREGRSKKTKYKKVRVYSLYFIYCLTIKSIPNKYHIVSELQVNSTEEENDRYHSPQFIPVQLLMD